ncbi:MAG: hypothetical protein IPO41_09280 [Acidobacteria bacterium]|nr:hypothetical protein [Acidobacteriota bacterium]MBK9528490.1 hypothetical protein [Acidobacteriota bacterium]
MIIDFVPVWLLFFLMVGVVLLSSEIGYRLGQKIWGKSQAERESPASAISGSILGLQAFMLAFTFGIVSDRYETKKSLVREESSAIRTAWHRADFLSEPDRTASKNLLREYVDRRVTLVASGDLDAITRSQGEILTKQRQLWEMAVVNGRADMNSDIGALYVESLNEISNLHAKRVGIGMQARIPTAIWAVLMSLLILGMISLGYYTAIADSRRSRVSPVLAVAFSLVIALIAALDHPGGSLMPVSQQPLVNVKSEMTGPN